MSETRNDGTGLDPQEMHDEAVQVLKRVYKEQLRPLEEIYKFDHFFTPLMEDADFEAKPMVLLLGQYSVGKTTFLRYLCGRDFPGIRIGPEPTTDRFVALMHGNEEHSIPGNALCVSKEHPFRGLSKFGTSFMSRLEGSVCPAPSLKNMILIDTPGVLSGEKQRIGRQYDFSGVVHWFATRSDRILLLFDAHKLDVSDEFRRTIEALKGNEDKVRVVLNKADSVSPKELMRVFGALMWSLGRVLGTPENPRVYIGSFWEKAINPNHENAELFRSEMADLLKDLEDLPKNAAIRKVNEFVKRARLSRVHAFIISHLKSRMPSFWGKSKKQNEILNNLPQELAKVASQHRIAPGDLPDPQRFRELVLAYDLSKFPKLNEKLIGQVDSALSNEIPKVMRKLQVKDPAKTNCGNPFAAEEQSGRGVSQEEKAKADEIFFSCSLTERHTLAGTEAKAAFSSTNLPNDVLFKIWQLADTQKRNELDVDEFSYAMHLVSIAKHGKPLPEG